MVAGSCDPWHLVSGATSVVTEPTDEVALVAALSGVVVTTADGFTLADPGHNRAELRALISEIAGDYAYVDPFTGEEMSLDAVIALLAFWRAAIDRNRPFVAAVGFAAWKRASAAPLLWAGGAGVPFSIRPSTITHHAQIAAWKSRVPTTTLRRLESAGAQLIEVEDGFIRSIGLGADCVPPLSLIVDTSGIYFDPAHPSDLEELLQDGAFSDDLLERARKLRTLIVARGVSKYDVGRRVVERRDPARRHILVPGQVEDDRSVLSGGGAIRTNLDLLRAVRRDAPDAYILYKPHPDVEAGHRVGAIDARTTAVFADEVVRDISIASLIDMVDEVHVNTSLAGFEALLRSTLVTAHGVPFYSGWGLTRDLGAMPARRTATRTLDELVAATLLLYPRYLDPVTGLPCTAEILVRRLADGSGTGHDRPLVSLRRWQGAMKRRLAGMMTGQPR